eukprot:Lankesteria_metandrocarpae@DN1121_c0_g1_i1.p1
MKHHSLLLYCVANDHDDFDNPNAFTISKRTEDITLRDVKSQFPLPGRYHFRFKMKFDTDFVWIDVTNDDVYVPSYHSKIFIKALRLLPLGTGPVAEHSRSRQVVNPEDDVNVAVKQPTDGFSTHSSNFNTTDDILFSTGTTAKGGRAPPVYKNNQRVSGTSTGTGTPGDKSKTVTGSSSGASAVGTGSGHSGVGAVGSSSSSIGCAAGAVMGGSSVYAVGGVPGRGGVGCMSISSGNGSGPPVGGVPGSSSGVPNGAVGIMHGSTTAELVHGPQSSASQSPVDNKSSPLFNNDTMLLFEDESTPQRNAATTVAPEHKRPMSNRDDLDHFFT